MPTVEEFNQPHRTGTADIGIMNEILSSASRNAQYAEALAQSASKYHLSQFKIMTLTPQKVREEFDNLRARSIYFQLEYMQTPSVPLRQTPGLIRN